MHTASPSSRTPSLSRLTISSHRQRSPLTVSRSQFLTLRLNLTDSRALNLTDSLSDSISRCHRRHHSHGVTATINHRNSWSHGCSLSLCSLLTDFQASSPFFKKSSVSQSSPQRNGMKCLILKNVYLSLSFLTLKCILIVLECLNVMEFNEYFVM